MLEIAMVDDAQNTACSGISVLCADEDGGVLEQGPRHAVLHGSDKDDTILLNKSCTVFGRAGIDNFFLKGPGFVWIDDFAPPFETIDLSRFSHIHDLNDLLARRNLAQEKDLRDGGYEAVFFELSPDAQLALNDLKADQLSAKNFIFAKPAAPSGQEAPDRQTDILNADAAAVPADASVYTGYDAMIGLPPQTSMIASAPGPDPQVFETPFPLGMF